MKKEILAGCTGKPLYIIYLMRLFDYSRTRPGWVAPKCGYYTNGGVSLFSPKAFRNLFEFFTLFSGLHTRVTGRPIRLRGGLFCRQRAA